MDLRDGRGLQSAILILSFLLLLGSVGSFALRLFFADALIISAYQGRSAGLVNTSVAIHRDLDPEGRTLDHFLSQGKDMLLRLAMTAGVLGGFLLAFRKTVAERLSSFLFAREVPHILALLRMACGGAMLIWVWKTPILPFADLPSDLVIPPPGWTWAEDLMPPGVLVLQLLQVITIVSALFVIVGLFSGKSALLLTISSVLLMGIPQFFGKIDHYHHLIWFTALLAASPSGAVWSLDSRRLRSVSGEEQHGPSGRFGFPVRVAMLLFGCIYLFPGLWKVIIGGWQWTGDTLRYQMYAKWMSLDWMPFFRLDAYPMLLRMLGVSVLLFEIMFIGALFSERWRRWMAFGGILFHIGIYMFMRINSWMLLVCYVVFLERGFLSSVGVVSMGERQTEDDHPGRHSRLMGGALLTAAVLSGISLTDSWPIAVFPTFGGLPQPNAFVLTVAAEDGGEVQPLKEPEFRERFGATRAAGLINQVVWSMDDDVRRKKAEALLPVLSGSIADIAAMDRVIIYRDLVSVDPRQWGAASRRREEILRANVAHPPVALP